MRPKIRFLEPQLIEKIVAEATGILCTLGVELHNPGVLELLGDHGAQVDLNKLHVILTEEIITKALGTAPADFQLFDVHGNLTHDFAGDNVYFTPGSTALHVLDYHSGKIRQPATEDYLQYAKVVSQLDHIASQSTALIPADVHEQISDSYRLFLSLLYGEKPVVTGTFTIESFAVMKDFQVAVRGDEQALKAKPLTVFSCCPTSPLKWSDVTSQNVVDCARYGIPGELSAMPLMGFLAPVTLGGTLHHPPQQPCGGMVLRR